MQFIYFNISFEMERAPNLLSDSSVRRQGQSSHCSFQLLLCGCRVAAVAAGHRSDLDVELLGLLIVKVGVAGVEVVLLLLSAAFRGRGGSRRTSSYCDVDVWRVHIRKRRWRIKERDDERKTNGKSGRRPLFHVIPLSHLVS